MAAMKLLTAQFYEQDTIDVAQGLLGKLLCHEIAPGQRLIGRISETEAYLGGDDPACHSFGFRKTPRVQVMYYPAGHSYVYFIYGMHFCFNVVTGDENTPEAVLVRAVFPVEGLDEMIKNRGIKDLRNLTNGPGKLCKALNITNEHNGLSLLVSKLKIFEDDVIVPPDEIEVSERIGLGHGSGDSLHWPLRYEWKPKKSGN